MKRLFIIFFLMALFAGGYAYYYLENGEDGSVLSLFGNVDVRQVDLGFRVKGRVDYMPYQEGDLVKAGALMGTIDKQPYLDRVREAKANMASIHANLENAERIYKRREELIKDGSISQEDYESAQSNRDVLRANLKQAEASLGVALTNLQDTEMYAPNDGVILTRIREPGTVVNEADPIYTLSLLAPVWIRAFVSEPNLGNIYPGMKAQIYTDSGRRVYEGHVGFISPVAEFTPKTVETAQLRTDLVYRLRIIAYNPDWGLRQGMPVTVKLPLEKEVKRIE
ncbi:MAG: efflux RND transporter periplasmic adaptor subunit [Parachlamydiaceae bacterium]